MLNFCITFPAFVNFKEFYTLRKNTHFIVPKSLQCISAQAISLRSTLILFCNLCLRRLCRLFLLGFWGIATCAFVASLVHITYLVCLLDIITFILFHETQIIMLFPIAVFFLCIKTFISLKFRYVS